MQQKKQSQDPILKRQENDLGFGTSISKSNDRLIRPDGSFNVERVGGGLGAFHPYQYLISIPWWLFTIWVFVAYLFVNALFAFLYIIGGIEGLSGSPGSGAPIIEQFAHGFYFSIQTFTTVGYGSISPISHVCSSLASFEALIGLLGFALATGVLFGRFAKATSKIRFSEEAIIAPYQNINGFMFRMVNRRSNNLINLEVMVAMRKYEMENGEEKMRFYRLPLERDKVKVFPMTWTIVHPIDQDSPFYGCNQQKLIEQNAEIMVMVSAYDEIFGQIIHDRMSYTMEDIIYGARFKKAFFTNDKGMMEVHVDKVDLWEKAALNPYSFPDQKTS